MPIFRIKSVKIYTGQKNLHGYIRGIRDKYEVWGWDENSIFIEPHQTQKQAVFRDLRSFVFSSSGFGMFFLWNGKARENRVPLKTTFICKCCFQTHMDKFIHCKKLAIAATNAVWETKCNHQKMRRRNETTDRGKLGGVIKFLPFRNID